MASEIESVRVYGKPPAGPTLDTSRATDLSSLWTESPNFNFASGANRPRFLQVRGVGETSQFEHAQIGAVGIFYEGIDLSEEASALPLLGRENVSVRVGPDSLNWGSKALAGRADVSSCLENACSAQRWQAEVGNYRTYGLRGGSVFKNAFVGAGVLSSDGFRKNSYLDEPTMKREEYDAVLGVAYDVGSLRFRQHHLFVSHDNGYDAWSFSPTFETLSDRPGLDRHQLHGHSLVWQDGKLWGLTSLTLSEQTEAYDEDWGNDPYWNAVPGWNADYDYAARFERERSKFHQKVGLAVFDFELGLHYYRYQEDQVIRSYKDGALRAQSSPEFRTQSFGVWSKREWRFREWTISTGGRIEKQWLELKGLGPSLGREVSPQWAAELEVFRDVGSFFHRLRLIRGFRGAGYNTALAIGPDRLAFEPEHLHLIELSNGVQLGSLRGELKVFQQWQGRQQSRSSLQTDPMDPNSFTYFTTNTEGARAGGAELTTKARWRALTASAGLGWLRSVYASGRETAQAPSWTSLLRVDYDDGAWNAFTQANGRDGYYFSDEHGFNSKPYQLIDVGLGYRAGRWHLEAWCKNAFDKRYPIRAYHFANEPPAWEAKDYVQLGDPRTYGFRAVFEL